MATLTVQIPAHAGNGADYVHNIGSAVRALFAAILAVPRSAPATTEVDALPVAKADREDLSLYRLYCLSSPYDSVMPNLAQELRMIAGRDQD
ncbi:hypothetical protein GCM10027343_41830 [Noviherbaspirillum agri]